MCFIIYYSVSSHNITKNNVFISILIFINLNIINRLYDINLSAKDNFSIFFLIVLYIYVLKELGKKLIQLFNKT